MSHKYKLGQVVYCGPPYDAYARVTKLRGDGTYDLSSARLEVPACAGWGGQQEGREGAKQTRHAGKVTVRSTFRRLQSRIWSFGPS